MQILTVHDQTMWIPAINGQRFRWIALNFHHVKRWSIVILVVLVVPPGAMFGIILLTQSRHSLTKTSSAQIQVLGWSVVDDGIHKTHGTSHHSIARGDGIAVPWDLC